MATEIKKIILPTTTEFVRYVNDVIFFRIKEGEDVTATLEPLVTRAKNLVEKKTVLLTAFKKGD